MSQWRVSKADIDGLVQAGIQVGIVPMESKDLLGQMLWWHNYLSVNQKYREHEAPPEYAFEGIEAPLDLLKVAKNVQCYVYQSDESKEWGEGLAHLYTERLNLAIQGELGLTQDELHEHCMGLEGCWGIDDIHQLLP